jgi:hypothetical protein
MWFQSQSLEDAMAGQFEYGLKCEIVCPPG